MYSESFIIEIANPGDQPEKYLLNYSGNDTEGIMRTKILDFIKKNKCFNSWKFSQENLDYQVIYFDDLQEIKIAVSKNTWNINNPKRKELTR